MFTRAKYDYLIDKLIGQFQTQLPHMSDSQVDRLETMCKAELWERHNQPNSGEDHEL